MHDNNAKGKRGWAVQTSSILSTSVVKGSCKINNLILLY